MSDGSYSGIKGLLDQVEQGIYVVSRESHEILYVNGALTDMAGGRDVCGQTCYAALHDLDAPCPGCQEHRSDGLAHAFHHVRLNRDLSVRTYRMDWEGVPAYVMVCTDVTESLRLKRKQEGESQEIKNLVDSIPGGIAKYKVVPEGLRMLYCSAGLAELLGMEMGEYAEEFSKDWEARIYESDRPLVKRGIEECVHGRGGVDLTYRLVHKGGGVLWVNAQGRLMEDEEHGAILHAVYHSLSAATALYRELLDCSDTIIHVSNFCTQELLYVNRAAAEFAGQAPDQITGKRCYEYMFGADSPCAFCNLEQSGEGGYQRDVDLGGRCYHLRAKRINWNGFDAYIEYARDITVARNYARAELEAQNAAFSAVDRALSGGTIISRPGLDTPPLYVSSNFERFLGYTREEFMEMYVRLYADVVHPEDYPRVLAMNRQYAAERPNTYEMEFRFVRKDGSVFWVLEKATYLDSFQGGPAYLSIFIDITGQKQVEEKLFERNATFDVLLENGGPSMWTYDITAKTAVLISSRKQSDPISYDGTSDYPESLIAAGVIRGESVEALRELMRKVDTGAPTACADIWYQSGGGELWCDKVTHVNIRSDSGEIIRTVGIAEDVTEQRLAQQQFDEELRNSESAQSEKLLVKMRCNLTGNVVESYLADPRVGISAAGMAYDAAVEALAAVGFTEQERELIRCRLNARQVLEEFEKGGHTYSLDYRRKTIDGRVLWVNSTVKTYRDLKSGDIKSFVYTTDINDEKINEELIYTVATTDSDYIALINLDTDEYRLFTGNVNDTLLPSSGTSPNYTQSVYEVDRACVHPDDMERCIADTLPAQMRKNLSGVGLFSGVYRVYDNNREIRYKKLQYTWLNESLGQVVLTRSDVTDMVLEQARQQELLKSALTQAEQASTAKTDFLSKMSHEIRTPMNAIIGMNALAAQNISDPEAVSDCIAKVGISARYLLTLINDILDMSRIESGKLSLRHEEIPVEEFLNGVNTVIYEQAAEKGISYDSIITGLIEESYVGDAMKLQQILINLLGNAVKFTSAGGKVQLIISQERVEKNTAHMKFLVNDTGCGISEEFQKVMFEPFEQEYNGTTAPYGGTGLGLAITKNLVELMGGRIVVNSIVGVGTEFAVSIPLGICGERARQRNLNVRLEKLSALVVDDEVLICEQVRSLLEDMGLKAEWVSGGRQAVDRIRKKWEEKKSYDIVLIDWKMPDMDGLETAREIRAIVGPDVTIIIITAYEWAEIEKEAKEAGVNLLLTKPLYRSSLTSAFERIFAEKSRVVPEMQTAEYDFSGRRVLLVEDHLMNIEVARRLLQSKGIEVEVAENGLVAIEAYASKPVGYFDAILMDIRMPVMDGLTAAKSIRQLKKATAKTIPIIAMSANAFDEDVEKTMAAGMNAHLSKPIEPPVLFATLHRFFTQSHR